MTLTYFLGFLAFGCVVCTLIFLRLSMYTVSTVFSCFGVVFTILSACQWRACILISVIGEQWLQIKENQTMAFIYMGFLLINLVLLVYNINKIRQNDFISIP